MKCPKCGYVTFDSLDQCTRCGAQWRSTRASLGPRLDEEFDRLYGRLKKEEQKKEQKAEEIQWGGFFRRAFAFLVDVEVLLVLSSLLFYFTYVGITVGLAAHGRSLTADNLSFFLRILGFVWFFLVSGYFVLLHGMEGKTVGKWLLGLRVVAANKSPVTYSQALIRWFAYIPSALFGLGFFWVLLDREKRGWHDLLARTWVVKG